MFRARRPRRGDDFDREIEAHLELETDRLIAGGLDPDEARRIARRVFGNVTAVRERRYESRRVLWFDHLAQDVRTAARNLTKYPIACAVAIFSLAVGIGATTATLVVRDTVFYRPPPLYREPAQLSAIELGQPDRPRVPVPAALFSVWDDDADLRPWLAASARGSRQDVRAGERLASIPIRQVTPDLFTLVGVAPALGRTFPPATAAPADRSPAVLSHGAWVALFDGRADALGEAIWIGDQVSVVIGVMPERFWFASQDSPIWTPLDPRALMPGDGLTVVARRPAGMTPGDLRERLGRNLPAYLNRVPAPPSSVRVQVWRFGGTPVGSQIAYVVPWLLAGAVLLTLFIACANVAILAIAQWTSREREIAIRASIGATRGRIVRLLVTESLLIAGLGGALGIVTLVVLLGLIASSGGTVARFHDLSVDPLVVLQSVAITLAAGIAAGLGPALLETRRLHGNPMRAIATSDRVRQRWRHALVVTEIAVTIALLVVTTTLLDGYRRNFSRPLGFETHGLVAAHVEHRTGVAAVRIVDALRQVPGVVSVGAATAVPFHAGPSIAVATDAGGASAVSAGRVQVGAGFFQTLDVHIRQGRPFSAAETATGSDVAIVNEMLAMRLFGQPAGQSVQLPDSIGRYVWIEQRPYRVVGVVTDYSASPGGRAQPGVFLPLAEARSESTRVQFLIRTSVNPGDLIDPIRRSVLSAAGGLTVTTVFSLDQVVTVAAQEILVSTLPLVPLVAIAMLLTAAGIYGVLAFAVTRRASELAIRVAIGATRGDLVRLVTTHSLRLIAIGSGVGIVATFGLSRVVRAAGGAGSILDPGWQAFAIPLAFIAVVGALATWLPSRRVLRIDPAILLRTQ